MTLYEFSTYIARLKREKKFDEALAFFKENKTEYTKEQISKNEHLISDMLYCLRGASHFDAGFKFLSIYNVEINTSTSERVLSAYGWLLWSKYKSENSVADSFHDADEYDFDNDESERPGQFHYQKSELILRIEQLIPLLDVKNTEFSKSVKSNLFSIVLKSEKNKPSPSWKLVDSFCNHFDPERLSTDCRTIKVQRKGVEKDMELASELESWYAYKTKAMQKLGRWQECFELSKKALAVVTKFHYSNDIWFSRRIALSKMNLGSPEETIAEFLAILTKKKEWFIQKELAELYLQQGNIDLAHKYAVEAANNFGPLEFKIDLLFLLGKIYFSKDERDLAFKHFALSKLVRSIQDPPWKVPQKLCEELKKFDNAEIDVAEIKGLESELKRVWRQSSPTQQPKPERELGNGVVKVILHDNERGKDGFLTSDKSDYYFNIFATDILASKVNLKSKVSFKVLPSKQPDKSRAKITGVID